MLLARLMMVFVVVVVLLPCSVLPGQEDGFVAIFDGKTLEGWKGDKEFWTVQDGAIVGQSTEEKPLKTNTFLVWQGGEMSDFELRLKFKISGSDKQANSGIQFRCVQEPDGHMVGYQADIDRAGNWCGALYDEKTDRKLLCGRGHKVTIDEKGERLDEEKSTAAALFEKIDIDDWNTYTIRAVGNHLTLSINGNVTAEVIDGDVDEVDLSGLLGLQLHSGPPMKIEFKDIHYKDLSGYKAIFDGQSLAGWKGDKKLWRVEEGAIVGETDEESKLKANQFLIWDEGEVEDFNLKLKFKVSGTARANSGVQIRSKIIDGFRLSGYQADIDRSGKFIGIMYSEKTGRGILCKRGEKVTIRGKKDKDVEQVNDAEELLKKIDMDNWNEMEVQAIGNHLVVKINGHTTAEVVDEDKEAFVEKGLLGLQLHVGPPMKIEFKDIRLKTIEGKEATK